MDFTLRNRRSSVDGVFGELVDAKGTFNFVTLEHAYSDGNGHFFPKIEPGVYTCVRFQSPHLGYEVWHLTGNDSDHHFFLIHIGNYNDDSDGCILIGKGYGNKSDGGKMIVSSKQAFAALMEAQKETDSFTLTVEACF